MSGHDISILILQLPLTIRCFFRYFITTDFCSFFIPLMLPTSVEYSVCYP